MVPVPVENMRTFGSSPPALRFVWATRTGLVGVAPPVDDLLCRFRRLVAAFVEFLAKCKDCRRLAAIPPIAATLGFRDLRRLSPTPRPSMSLIVAHYHLDYRSTSCGHAYRHRATSFSNSKATPPPCGFAVWMNVQALGPPASSNSNVDSTANLKRITRFAYTSSTNEHDGYTQGCLLLRDSEIATIPLQKRRCCTSPTGRPSGGVYVPGKCGRNWVCRIAA